MWGWSDLEFDPWFWVPYRTRPMLAWERVVFGLHQLAEAQHMRSWQAFSRLVRQPVRQCQLGGVVTVGVDNVVIAK